MANKQIYELNNAGNDLDNSALLAMDIPNPDSSAASEIPYVTRKASVNAVESQMLGADEYTTELNTKNQTIFGSINEVLTYAKNIAEEYDDTETYAIGDFVTYEGVLYKCIVAIAVAESWDSTHWDSTLIVEEFGSGGGGASVTLGTTTPSDASGSNGDLYVQYDGTSYAAVFAYVKINNAWRKFPYSKVVALTQAEYDLITPDTTTLYIITDAQSSYQTKADNSLDTDDKTVVGAINELNSGKADSSDIPTKTSELTNDSGFTIGTTNSWGTTLEISYIKSNFLLFVGDRCFSIWFSGSGYANPSIRNLGNNTSQSGIGSVTIDDVTITRTTNGMKVQTNSNSTITIFG